MLRAVRIASFVGSMEGDKVDGLWRCLETEAEEEGVLGFGMIGVG